MPPQHILPLLSLWRHGAHVKVPVVIGFQGLSVKGRVLAQERRAWEEIGEIAEEGVVLRGMVGCSLWVEIGEI